LGQHDDVLESGPIRTRRFWVNAARRVWPARPVRGGNAVQGM